MNGDKEKTVSESENAKIHTLVVAAIGLSAYAWGISFNFGTFGVIFLGHIIAVWLFSLSVILVTVIIDNRILPGNKRAGYTMLILPTIWLILRIIDDPSATGQITDYFHYVLSVLSIVISLPYLVYLFLYFTNPGIIHLKRKLMASLAGFVLLIALIGYTLGSHNYLIMSCQEFVISGQDTPKNCRSLESQK